MEIERFTGSDCSGSDDEKNRTLTINNTKETTNKSFQVFVNNSFLHLNTNYIVNHKESNSIITFLNYLWDDQNITIIYAPESYIPNEGASGILPLDTQLINNEINYFGDTITVRAVSKLDYDKRGNSQEILGDSKISYTSGDDALSAFYGTNWIAQTFTTSSSIINIISIKIKIKRTGTPGAITIGIKAVDGNLKPTGSDLTSGTLDYTDLIDDGDTEWVTLPLSSYTLSANTTYALVIREASGNALNKYEARIKTTGSYSGGNNLTSSDSGSSWSIGSSDILFDLYGDTEAKAFVDVLTLSDDSVKLGQFQSGDIKLNFQNSEENIIRGTLIKYRGIWYQIDEVTKDSAKDTNYFLEAIARKY